MNHLAYLDPPIEVLAAGARLEMILSRLRSGRMRPFRADLPISYSSSEALLLDTQSLDENTLIQFIKDIGQSLRPILILGDPALAGYFANAVFIPRDRDLSVLRGRLDAITRRSARMSELRLRRETAATFGVTLPEPSAETVPDLLYLGDGSSRFLALQAALGERGGARGALRARKPHYDPPRCANPPLRGRRPWHRHIARLGGGARLLTVSRAASAACGVGVFLLLEGS